LVGWLGWTSLLQRGSEEILPQTSLPSALLNGKGEVRSYSGRLHKWKHHDEHKKYLAPWNTPKFLVRSPCEGWHSFASPPINHSNSNLQSPYIRIHKPYNSGLVHDRFIQHPASVNINPQSWRSIANIETNPFSCGTMDKTLITYLHSFCHS
jgi:hypothetical protein